MGRIDYQSEYDVWQFRRNEIKFTNSVQTVYCGNAMDMYEIGNSSIHLIVTSPPYFNAKKYSTLHICGDLGSSFCLDSWIEGTKKVWLECYRVLKPGRKLFINIMNLPIKYEKSFRTLNLAGMTISQCEDIGFIFKRDIIWHKTNGVRAPFGTYPYPGGILINNMHEFILEFEKPSSKSENSKKYAHVSKELKEASKLNKDFWLQIKNSDVWTFAPHGSGEKRNHPAPFPIELPSRLIKAFTFQGECVLDPFLGSGTTLMSAALLKRDGIGYEINPKIATQAVLSLSAENARQLNNEILSKS